MSNQVATQQSKPSALTVMAARYNVEPAKLLSTLKETCFKGATDEQMMALCIVANEYGMNPFLKEIYAFPAKGGGIVPVVGVDGWVHLMNDKPTFDGIEFEIEDREEKPYSVTAIIFVKGRGRPVKVTEYLSECKRNTDPWNTCPRRMLRHKALIQGARIAFGFSGIYDEDEAEQIKTVSGREVKPIFAEPKKLPPAESTPVPSDAFTPTAPQESTASASVESKPSESAKAPGETPLEAVIRLLSESDITPEALVAYCKRDDVKLMSKDQTRITDMGSKKLTGIVERFSAIAAAIQEGGEE